MIGLFALFGNPISHTKSPLLHNYTFSRLFQNLSSSGLYGRILLENGKDLRQSFFAHGLCGANITIPFKEEAFKQCDEVRGIARDIGACNTWVRERINERTGKGVGENVSETQAKRPAQSPRVIGYNTDAEGFYLSIKDYAPKSALVLGAGGSSRAVCYALRSHGIEPVVLNRSSKGLEFFASRGFRCYVGDELDSGEFDMVINTTPAGLNDTSLPLEEGRLARLLKGARYAYDLIYGKQTPFLALAQAQGKHCQDGGAMLLYQAVLAFEIFATHGLGVRLEREEIASVMSEIARGQII